MNDSLRVQLRPSRTLACAVVLGHLLALAAAGTGLPPAAAAVATVGLLLSLVHYWRWATHRTPAAVAALELRPDGGLAVAGPGAAWQPAALRYVAVPASWLALVIARDDAGRDRRALILPDALDPGSFRRLRVLLRWRTIPAVEPRCGIAGDARR